MAKKTKKSKKTTSVKFSKKHLFLIALIFGAMSAFFIYRSFAATVNFTKVATHPQASTTLQSGAAPTAWHKTITSLKAWNGKLYAGYGDYNANTGPIAINPFDGTKFASNSSITDIPYCARPSETPSPEVCKSQTEATWLWRVLGGKLYAPSTDPTGGAQSDYAVGISSGGLATWVNPQIAAVSATHAFDMATVNGTDLWLVGSKGNNATVWRSQDGGANWETSLTIPPKNTTSGDFSRFYGIGVYGGKIYVQATDYNGGMHAKAKVLADPSTNNWVDATTSIGYLTRAEEFNGKLVFSWSYHTGITSGSLQIFNGSSTSIAPGTSGIYDFTIDRTTNTIYILGTDNIVKKSTNLTNWEIVGTGPPVARSIEIFQGSVYLGGTDSGL